jgi:hypothetical protein
MRPAARHLGSERRYSRDESDMGTIIQFPADAASRRPSPVGCAPRMGPGNVLILPVVRIEREGDGSSDGKGPEQGAAQGRPRRRR